MSKFAVLRNIFLIAMLVGVVLTITYYAEPVEKMALGVFSLEEDKVLGASSERAKEITDKVGADVAGHVAALQQQALEITLGDVFSTLLRAQQIPQDIQSVHEFVKEQANNVLQSGDKN